MDSVIRLYALEKVNRDFVRRWLAAVKYYVETECDAYDAQRMVLRTEKQGDMAKHAMLSYRIAQAYAEKAKIDLDAIKVDEATSDSK